MGLTHLHKVLLAYVTEELHTGIDFENLTPDQSKTVLDDAEEWYLSYVFLRQSSVQNNKLKEDLQNRFTTGKSKYPKTSGTQEKTDKKSQHNETRGHRTNN